MDRSGHGIMESRDLPSVRASDEDSFLCHDLDKDGAMEDEMTSEIRKSSRRGF
jgi:hypothetical protein